MTILYLYTFSICEIDNSKHYTVDLVYLNLDYPNTVMKRVH